MFQGGLTMNEAGCMDEASNMEFPVTNLFELESRVFTDMWNIPFKREESLGKCLIASTRLMEAGMLSFKLNTNWSLILK